MRQEIHFYEKRSRENYQTMSHRTVVHESLPSQAGVPYSNFINNALGVKHSFNEPLGLKALCTAAILTSYWQSMTGSTWFEWF